MPRTLPIVATMIAYAIALIFMGVLTYMAKPPAASALTALLIPSIGGAIIIVCGVLTAQINKNVRNARIGVYLGIAITTVLIVAPALRLGPSLAKNQRFNDSQKLALEGSVVENAPNHPTGYQAVGLGGVAALSFFALIAMIAQRPKWSIHRKPDTSEEVVREREPATRPMVERQPEPASVHETPGDGPSDSFASAPKLSSNPKATDELDDLLRRDDSKPVADGDPLT